MNLYDDRLPPFFWTRVIPEPNSGCWIWIGNQTVGGYGTWRREYTHRLAVAAARGPIPDGMHTDHLCRTTLCCNPAHLEVVTPTVNVRRGMRGSLRKHCKHGHEYTPENTWRHADGNRYCRTCKLAVNRARSARPEVKEHVRQRRPAKIDAAKQKDRNQVTLESDE